MTQSTAASSDVKPITDLHAVPIQEIYKRLETRPQGLTEAEIKDRQNRFGRNSILKIKGKPLILKLLAKEKEIIKVGQVIVVFGEKGEAVATEPPPPKPRSVGVVGEVEEGAGMVGEAVLFCPKCKRIAWEDSVGAIRSVL